MFAYLARRYLDLINFNITSQTVEEDKHKINPLVNECHFNVYPEDPAYKLICYLSSSTCIM